jgi:hypothetical protein
MLVPAVTPVTVPELGSTDAVPGNEETQLPPLTPSVQTVVFPTHNPLTSVIEVGAPVTVTVVVVLQPVGTVNVIIAVP